LSKQSPFDANKRDRQDGEPNADRQKKRQDRFESHRGESPVRQWSQAV